VLSNWETQIADHCVPGALSTYTYYGSTRNVDPEVLKAYDVVLTTYQTVSSDFERSGGFKTAEQLIAESKAPSGKNDPKGLFDIQWKVRATRRAQSSLYLAPAACGT
jgi:SWI/SNF-related matrix-associated actin-dependent regulator of chromatin subfamily A3